MICWADGNHIVGTSPAETELLEILLTDWRLGRKREDVVQLAPEVVQLAPCAIIPCCTAAIPALTVTTEKRCCMLGMKDKKEDN